MYQPNAGNYLGDATPTYTTWTDRIKRLGGVVVVWPFNDAAKGKPAARFDVATYVALFNGGSINAQDKQQAANNNEFVYVLAPDDVARAALELPKVTPTEASRLPGGLTGWNPFANTSTLTKVVVGSAIVTGLAALSGLFHHGD